MKKKLNNIQELLKDMGVEESTQKDIAKESSRRSLSSLLFALRSSKGYTQKQVAEKVGCTQSKISKIESSYDDEVSVRDLLEYGNAIGFDLEIGFRSRSVKIIDLIHHHIFRLECYLKDLVSLGKGDVQIEEGVVDCLNNILCSFKNSIEASKLQLTSVRKGKMSKKSKGVHVSLPLPMKKEVYQEELV